jgi:serine protease
MRPSSWINVFGGLLAAVVLVAAGQDPAGVRILVRPPFVPPADAEQFAPDRVVVKFAGEITPQQIDEALAPAGVRWLRRGLDDAFDVLQVEAGTVAEWVARLSTMPGVEYAEPDYVAWASHIPNDPYYAPYQWNFFDWGRLSNGVKSNFGVQGETAWDTTTGSGVIVAIVDTGVAYENFGSFVIAPDLSGQTFVTPKDFVNGDLHANDDNGHGTHVCGTIMQVTDNSTGVAGLANTCKVMPVKVLNSSGSGSYTNISDGIRWAADNGAFVINLSLGGSSGSTTLKNAVDYAWNKGCVLCAATGNSGAGQISYPARYANCIAVGATRFDGKKCGYSQFGTGIDVVAPGGDMNVDQNGDGYGDGILQQTFQGSVSSFAYYFFTGTSMATPHVSAIAALVKSNKSAYTNTDVRNAIETTTKDLGTKGYDTKFGWGLVSAKDALTY